MKHLKLFFALFAMLALGVGNAWGAEYQLVKSSTDLVAGCHYVIGATYKRTTYFMATTSNTNNRKLTSATVTNEKVTLTSDIMTFTLGGSNNDWTFKTDNYAGTAGYLNATNTTSNNYLKIVAKDDQYNKFTISVDANGVATITCNGKTSRHIMYLNGTTCFACYNNQTQATYVKPSLYKEVTSEPSTPATTYTVTIDRNIQNGTVKADVAEAAEGATVTLTATPATGYKFGAWDVKDASSNPVDVDVDANGKFTMPASNVTVSASFVAKTQYTIKWNVAEGSVADTKVYEGDALSTLPKADHCSEGKKFIGWTTATSVNPDGSGLVLAQSTDVPDGNKEYNAVYATLSGSADKVDNLDLSLTGASGSTYSSWSGKKSVSDAVYAGNSAGGNSAIQLRKSSETQAKSGIITTTSGGKAKKVVVTWNSNTADDRTLNVYGSNSAYSSVDNLYTDATAGTLIGTIVNGTSTELDITGDYEYIGMRSNASAMYLDKIQITWSASSASDYSLDCGTNNTPFLTVTETAFDFGTVAQNETATETFDVTGGYLAEDVALTISGTNASFFDVSPNTIAKADDVEETVTVTYNPTATGDHTATLTIKTGDITKEIALSGKVLAPGKWVLVKDVASLSAGDEIIIAAANADYAIGAAASNNYKGAAITKVGETANADAGVTVLKVEATGDAEVPYAFKAGSNYLYAASSSANQLKGKTTLDVNGQWAVTITEGVASIVAAKSSNRNVMQCNPNNGSPIFACYSSADYQQLAIYRNSENVVKPVISGDTDFTGSTQVTITAQSGLTVYYTTNDSDPDNTSTQYTAPFTINATTTVKAIAYDASSNASDVAEMTFTKHDLVNVETAMALEEDEVAYFDEFEVVKVVAGKGNIYIKDASGHGLIFDNTLAGQLKDGDRVQGFVGISSPYSGLPEAKPYNVTYEDLTITAGTPAEPYDFTSTTIEETDINKYIVFQNVEITENTDMSTNPTLTIGGNSVKFYNQFGVSKTLEAGKIYDIYGFVAIYNGNLQVYFYQALEEGEVVTKYTVTYNAGGATGEVPVDGNEYTEGSQVTLKSATGLTKEGYDYKGWKVTDKDGNEIAVSSNKFNMPASNVIVTAQWEEIVVTPRQDFSAGLWVLVTDASELAANDYIIVAAAEENFAMKSYESGNNCKQVAITKFGNNNCFLTWTEEIGVFQLLASGSNYTIQDVNTKQYLYAAGTGTSNQLRASNNIATDENASKYVWTITVETNGIATVKATSENRNWLRYNTNSGSDLFSCYGSGQQDIVLYKYVTDFYTRDVTNKYGTICLPYGSTNYDGATFYEVAGKGTENGKPAVYLASVDALEAGVPYIFEKTANQIKVVYTGEAVDAPQNGDANGLVGTFVETTVPDGMYILYQGAFCTNEPAGTLNKIKENRAYLNMANVEGDAPQQMPGRRYIGMSVQGENEATGFENITAPEGQTIKAIVNGQLIIIRDGEKFNAQGQKL